MPAAWTDDRMDDLARRMDEGFRRMDQRLDRVEDSIRLQSADLRADMKTRFGAIE